MEDPDAFLDGMLEQKWSAEDEIARLRAEVAEAYERGVREERERWQAVVDANTGPTGGWLCSPKKLQRADSAEGVRVTPNERQAMIEAVEGMLMQYVNRRREIDSRGDRFGLVLDALHEWLLAQGGMQPEPQPAPTVTGYVRDFDIHPRLRAEVAKLTAAEEQRQDAVDRLRENLKDDGLGDLGKLAKALRDAVHEKARLGLGVLLSSGPALQIADALEELAKLERVRDAAWEYRLVEQRDVSDPTAERDALHALYAAMDDAQRAALDGAA